VPSGRDSHLLPTLERLNEVKLLLRQEQRGIDEDRDFSASLLEKLAPHT